MHRFKPHKFKELILYTSERLANDPWFGATKLNKVLYYADVYSWQELDVPITGARYFRLDNGPAPRALLPIRREMMDHGELRIEQRTTKGKPQHRTIPLRSANRELFSPKEVAIMDRVIEELRPLTASEVSKRSHTAGWRSRKTFRISWRSRKTFRELAYHVTSKIDTCSVTMGIVLDEPFEPSEEQLAWAMFRITRPCTGPGSTPGVAIPVRLAQVGKDRSVSALRRAARSDDWRSRGEPRLP